MLEIYKTDKQLFVFDIHSGGEIYCHNLSLIPGQKVIIREHFRQKESSVGDLKKQVLDQFSFLCWKRFAEQTFRAFPRYVRDQCLLAQKHFGEKTDLVVLEHAVEFCLSNKTYCVLSVSVRNPKEIYEIEGEIRGG